ncbi:DUF1284 domain-containing protein [Falsirhodobacter algicola]|uniref:DUF1284 domain-containing protein n=1 Tax=Falsirhodobacter algicola TaxID=2692330 RepID=A0A8J8SLT4_9RHOB|nr:DUF1284 domain-containing protein [Falsirhodobacter algicola]QUS36749.1 DUF1284 domain-containing protein [Falsirhodobacter algicola]
MTIRLRPHHLLCLLTYVGKGYSAAFVANYDRIAARLSAGEDVVVTDGPDDICAPLLDGAEPHCWRASVIERDRHAAREVGALLGRTIAPGARIALTPARLAALRGRFAEGGIRAACGSCPWSDLCTAVAQGGYDGARVVSGR